MPQISAKEIAEHKAKGKRPKSMRIEEAENGGYIATHDTDSYPSPRHVFKNHKEMLAHVKSHMCPGEK